MGRLLAKPMVIAALVSLIAAASIALIAWEAFQRQQQSVAAPAALKPASDLGGPIVLVDRNGNTVTDADFGDKYLLMYFGFTYCPDACLTDLPVIAQAYDTLVAEDPAYADKIIPVFVTIDPERDTPDLIGGYAEAFHPEFLALTGTPEQVADVAGSFKVLYSKHQTGEAADEYTMDHTTMTYLFKPGGRVELVFRHNTDPDAMAAAVADFLSQS